MTTEPYPSHRQREAMQSLMQGEWLPLLKLAPAGDTMLATLANRGWIDRRSDGCGGFQYRITDAGRLAFGTTQTLLIPETGTR